MVNENQGKEYNPIPVYNRKMIRNMIRAQLRKKSNHEVNRRTGSVFHNAREGKIENA